MRILQITGEYSPMQGGVGDFTRELSRELAAQGHGVCVLTRYLPDAAGHEQIDGVDIHRVMPAWGWDARRRIEAFVRVHGFDVANLQYQAAAFQMHPAINLLPGALSNKLPTVVTFHDLLVPYLFPKAGALRWKAIANMARTASACIVTNSEDAAKLATEGITNASLIPIGSNVLPSALSGFDRSAWLQARGIDPALTLIGYFGFMNQSKGGETLMRALAELRNSGINAAVLHIGGQTGASDPTNAEYAKLLRELGRSCGAGPFWFETGFLQPADVSAGFAACACLALPYRDGASYRRGTLMAALAHRCAIVTTTPRVDVPAFCDGDNMLFVPPDDASATAAAIKRLLADPPLAAHLSAGAGALSSTFAWPGIARASAQLFEQIARGR
jgi:glycosyltransferase involved in cell wall biosynthesis